MSWPNAIAMGFAAAVAWAVVDVALHYLHRIETKLDRLLERP